MFQTDEFYMTIAVEAANTARDFGEIPIGACLVDADGEILAVAGNRTISDSDPTAHAEILALREAARKISNYRLVNSTIYSTVEPCAMCAGALVNARIKRLVYAADDERFGAARSIFRICDSPQLNHRIEITNGILAAECRELMQNFFKKKRAAQKMKQKIAEQT